MTEPTPRDEILTGRNESTPFRALHRVFLVVAAVVIVIGAIIYGVYAAVQ
jgi:hypothetical protein